MSVTAASSAVLASAPPPQRYALGQDKTSYQINDERALISKALKFGGLEAFRHASGKEERDIVVQFAEENGLDVAQASLALGRAGDQLWEAETKARLETAGVRHSSFSFVSSPSAPAAPAKYQGFGSVEAAKSFAFQKLDELKAGLASHNAWVKDFSNGGAQKMREQVWQSAFDQIKKFTPETSDADAIKKADSILESYIKNNEGLTGYLPGQGNLENMFDLSGPLFTTNADGTLTLNNVQARYNGALIFEIGTPTAQNVDKVA